jgi:hypothetical protein
MTTFRTTSRLSKPEGRERIPQPNLAYLQTRNRLHLFRLVHEAFQKSGLSQADLASRLGKGTDRICKILGSPGNWTADTASDLIFAITGGVLKYSISYPLDRPKRNDIRPEWVRESWAVSSSAAEVKFDKELSAQRQPRETVSQTANTAHWEAAV